MIEEEPSVITDEMSEKYSSSISSQSKAKQEMDDNNLSEHKSSQKDQSSIDILNISYNSYNSVTSILKVNNIMLETPKHIRDRKVLNPIQQLEELS